MVDLDTLELDTVLLYPYVGESPDNCRLVRVVYKGPSVARRTKTRYATLKLGDGPRFTALPDAVFPLAQEAEAWKSLAAQAEVMETEARKSLTEWQESRRRWAAGAACSPGASTDSPSPPAPEPP